MFFLFFFCKMKKNGRANSYQCKKYECHSKSIHYSSSFSGVINKAAIYRIARTINPANALKGVTGLSGKSAFIPMRSLRIQLF